jgi:hypothetical protein
MYMMYAAFQMKANDIIKSGVILPPTVNANFLKDREGFKKYAYPRHMAEGAVLIILGMVGIGLDVYGYQIYHAAVYAVVLIVWIIFYMSVEKGKKKFYKYDGTKKRDKK